MRGGDGHRLNDLLGPKLPLTYRAADATWLTEAAFSRTCGVFVSRYVSFAW